MSGTAEKVDVWMPLYIGDYLADTTRLSTEAHGAYLLLIMDYWRKGAPPDDDEVLAQITRSSRAVWKKLRKILSSFFQIIGGVWRHAKIEKLKGQAADGRGKANEKAKAAALARWEKKRAADAAAAAGADAPGIAPSIAQALPGSCPSPSSSELTHKAAAAVPGIPRDPDASHAPPLPARQEPKTETSPAVVLTSTLRKMGVNVTSMHPILLGWVSSGVSLQQLVEAVGIARERKGPDEKLAPGYVHAILGDILNPLLSSKTAAPVEVRPWWLSVSGIDAKGLELGLPMTEGETFPFYKLRVYAAAGPGPWSELGARALAPVEQGFKKAGVVVDVAAEREKMKQITRPSAVN